MNTPRGFTLKTMLPVAICLALGVIMSDFPATASVPSQAGLGQSIITQPVPINPWALMSPQERQQALLPSIRRLARAHGLEPALVMAVIKVESNFRPWVISGRGAMGLMQINPVTAEELDLADPLDPEENLEAGIRYLAYLEQRFDRDLTMMLAAYNAGPTRVSQEGQVPEFNETKQFVQKVLRQLDHFRLRLAAVAQK